MNVLSLTGHCGSDAEVKSTPTGKQVVTWNVAMNSGFGDKKTTTWIRCSMWGDRGVKLAPYLLKGGLVGVTGEFSAREWEKDGVTKTSCELRVNDVTLLGSPDRAKYDNTQPKAEAAPAAVPEGDFNDDIPF